MNVLLPTLGAVGAFAMVGAGWWWARSKRVPQAANAKPAAPVAVQPSATKSAGMPVLDPVEAERMASEAVKHGDCQAAAELYERAGMLGRAIEMYRRAGNVQEAAELELYTFELKRL